MFCFISCRYTLCVILPALLISNDSVSMKENVEQPLNKVMTDAGESSNGTDYISGLPTDCILHILSFLSPQPKARFLQTSSGFLKKGEIQYHWDKVYSNQLISYVLLGEEETALKMIKAKPYLLLIRGTNQDYTGRVYEEVTAFQAALLCHDKWMWKKMLPLFKNIKMQYFNADEEIARQFLEVFPDGIPEQKPYDFDSLIEIIGASSPEDVKASLVKNNNGTDLSEALAKFKKEFTELSLKEKFYNPQHLIRLITIYNEKYEKYPSWTTTQLELFWSQVYGFAQRFVSTCYAQKFCQGFSVVTEKENQPLTLERSLSIQEYNYYELQEVGLGSDFGIYSDGDFGNGGPPRLFEWSPRFPVAVHFIENLYKAYMKELDKLQHEFPIEYSPPGP